MSKAAALAILFAAVSVWPLGAAYAQPPRPGPAGITDNPCPPPLKRPPEVEALQKARPRALFESKDPIVTAFLQEEMRQRNQDRAGACRYRTANAELIAKKASAPAAVFIGDSITDFWPNLDGEFFTANRFTGRGIGAQVSSQGLSRFEQDVVELHPKVVHILYGTNDIAGLGGPTTFQNVQNNLTTMVQLARANKIAVVVGTILPISHLPGGATDASLTPNIVKMNAWIREYGKRENIPVADYYTALAAPDGGFKTDLNSDGVHPNVAGYRVMEPLTRAAIQAATRKNGKAA